jgi:hypothetical protein
VDYGHFVDPSDLLYSESQRPLRKIFSQPRNQVRTERVVMKRLPLGRTLFGRAKELLPSPWKRELFTFIDPAPEAPMPDRLTVAFSLRSLW